MSGRRRKREGVDVFNNHGSLSPQETDSAIFGDIAKADAGRQIAQPINIKNIYPDPAQPRRAIPTEVRFLWTGEPDALPDIFDAWLRLVSEKRQSNFDLVAYIMADEDAPERSDHESAIESSLLSLADLASSIRRDGLTNPITVARRGRKYQIETGERRWLAFHLLHAYIDHEAFAKMPARVVERVDVWRQATENAVRANLNAISLARQFAVLLMDLHPRQAWKTYGELVPPGACDRLYYAQVGDGEQYRIPRGQGAKLLTAMGLKTGAQLRRYRALLRLPDYFWQIADDLNWTENFIRDLLNKARHGDTVDEKYLMQVVYQEAYGQGYSVSIDTVPDDHFSAPTKPATPKPEPLAQPQQRDIMQTLMKLKLADVEQMDAETQEILLSKIEAHRRWLNEIENLLLGQFPK